MTEKSEDSDVRESAEMNSANETYAFTSPYNEDSRIKIAFDPASCLRKLQIIC